MKKYCLVSKDTLMSVGSIECDDPDKVVAPSDCFLVEAPGNFDVCAQYVLVNGSLELVPPRPSIDHKFNVSTRQWELDCEQSLSRLKAHMRAMRDDALNASDWTQMPDVPLSPEQRAAWAAYRQALRDLPQHPDWPHVTFPNPPA